MSIVELPTVSPEELEMWPTIPATPLPPSTIEKEAARMDHLFPGWENRVKIRTLDIDDAHHCILAQCAYRKFLFLRIPIGFWRGINRVCADCRGGRDMYDSDAYHCNATRPAWIAEINKRREHA